MSCIYKTQMIRKTVCFFILILLLGIFSGCAKDETNSGSNAANQSDTLQEEQAPVLEVGEAGRTDKFEMTVTNVTKAAEWINSPAEGREYVIVAIKVKNISDEEESIGVNDFQYINDESGERENYARTTGVKTDPDTFGAESIAPGDTFEGSIVFDIPVAMNKVELHYREGYVPEPLLRFEFNKQD